MLDSAPALVNAKDTSLHGGGYTPLLYASYVGAHELCAQLIARGAEVNAANDAGCTALMLAAQQGHVGVAALLLGSGADPTRTDNTCGFSALDLAFDSPSVGALLVTGRLPPDAPPEALAAAAMARVAFPVCAPPEALRAPPSLALSACSASLQLGASGGRELCPATRALGSAPAVIALRPPLPIALDEPPPIAVDVLAALTLSFSVSWAPEPAPVYVPAALPQQRLGGDTGAASPSPRVPLPPSLFEVAILQLTPTGSGVVAEVAATPAAIPEAAAATAADPASPPMLPPARGAPQAAAAWLLAQTQSDDSATADATQGFRGSSVSISRAKGVAAAVVFRGSVPASGAQAQPASAATAAAFPLSHSVTRITVSLPLRLLCRPAPPSGAAASGRVPFGCDATMRFVAKVRCVNALGRSAWSSQSDPAGAAVRITVDAAGVSSGSAEARLTGPVARVAATAVTPQAGTPPRRVVDGVLPRIFDVSHDAGSASATSAAAPANMSAAPPIERALRRGSIASDAGLGASASGGVIDSSVAMQSAVGGDPSSGGPALPPLAAATPALGIGARPRSSARQRPPQE